MCIYTEDGVERPLLRNEVGKKKVEMQLSNDKWIERGVKMIMGEIPVSYEVAAELLKQFGSVRKAVEQFNA